MQMSYDEYLEHFERVRRQRAAAGRPDSAEVRSCLQVQQGACTAFPCKLLEDSTVFKYPYWPLMLICCLQVQQGAGQGLGGGMMGTTGMMGAGMMGGGQLMGGAQQMGGGAQQMMSEEAYIEHCRGFTAQKGVLFNEVQVRQYYREMRARMGL